MPLYNPHKRTHNIAWLYQHSKHLYRSSKELQDVSFVLYCCLELRNLLELLEFDLLLASVSTEEKKNEIRELAKPKNGIRKVNDELKTLKEKFQTFYDSVARVNGIASKVFYFSESNDLKYELSDYVHTYTRFESEMLYDSDFISKSFNLIKKSFVFIDKSIVNDGTIISLQNLVKDELQNEDILLYEQWKSGIVKDLGELEKRIKFNIDNRINYSIS